MTRGTQKELGLLATALIASALLFWWLTAQVSDLTIFTSILTLAVGLIWVAIMSIVLGLIRRPALVTTVIIAVPLLAIIIGRFSVGVITAATILIIILALTRARTSNEIRNRRIYQSIPIFYTGTRWLIIGLFITTAGFAIAAVADTISARTINIPEQAVEYVLIPFRPLIAGVAGADIPGATSTTTSIVNQYINNVTNSNPWLAALATLVTLLIVSRILVPFLAWPTLGLIAFFVFLLRRSHFVHLDSYQAIVKGLKL